VPVVGQQALDHFVRRDVVVVVVRDGLQLADVTHTAQRRPADAAHALG
jgi:hypothetical protein